MTADLDIEKISRELGITPDFYRELLHDFMEQAAGDLKRIEELQGSDAFSEIASRAHAMNGAALNLKIERVAAIVREIERAGNESKDKKIIEANVSLLKKALEELKCIL